MKYLTILLLLCGCADMTAGQKAAVELGLQIGVAVLKTYIGQGGVKE